jgi:multicomponent Na+:H+ antiporter subunit F
LINLDSFLGVTVTVALGLLALALILTFVRLLRGPSLSDRVVALDMFSIMAMGLIALRVIATGQALYLEIAIALGLVAFLATVFFARLIEARGGELREGSDVAPPEEPGEES